MTETGTVPDPRFITSYAPTTINALADCGYRVALVRSKRARARPNTFTALGQVVHRMHERDAAGEFDVGGDQRTRQLEAAWERLVADEDQRLREAYGPPGPPPPRDWPGYARVKSRTLRRMRHTRRPSASEDGWVKVEIELRDERSGLYGRIDRLEKFGSEFRVVDLKSGAWQGAMSGAQRRQLSLYCALVHDAYGEWPAQMAIERADGTREVELVVPTEIDEVRAEATRLVAEYNSTLEGGWPALEDRASPDADLCRRCPARLCCHPYWRALRSDWEYHGAIGGQVEDVVGSDRAFAVRITCAYPSDASGQVATIYALPLAPAPGSGIAVVGCEQRGDRLTFRYRWDSDVALDDPFQSQAVEQTAAAAS